MRTEAGQTADWRDAEAYAPLLGAERATFAWEWLRRDEGYRQAAARAGSEGSCIENPDAARWALHRFEDPELSALEARPIWRAEKYPFVLAASAEEDRPAGESFDLRRFEALATLVRSSSGTEHLLFSDGLKGIRLDIVGGTILKGPVRLHYRLSGLDEVQGPLLVLRRLLALWRHGRFATKLHAAEAKAARFVLMLRAYDALMSGATQRHIAGELLDRDALQERWRVRSPAVRLSVQRLVRGAAEMAAGGYQLLLGPRPSAVREISLRQPFDPLEK